MKAREDAENLIDQFLRQIMYLHGEWESQVNAAIECAIICAESSLKASMMSSALIKMHWKLIIIELNNIKNDR